MFASRMLMAALLFLGTSSAFATSICYNNYCGRIVCRGGCVQQVVNGRCVANYCTGKSNLALDLAEEDFTPEEEYVGSSEPFEIEASEKDAHLAAGYCVSCKGRCCHAGHSFLSAERACKSHHGSFGCFTRCR